MNQDERKAFNAKCLLNRKAKWGKDPDAKAESIRRNSEWKKQNPENIRESARNWRERNPERALQIQRASEKRRRSNPKHRAKLNLKSRFRELMGSVKDGGHQRFSKLIGCTTAQLASHLESKFKRGMTWENYGTHWHVDHIIPCAAFDHANPDQARQCWHFTNLAPLEAKKNLAKSDKITAPQLSLLLSV
jgi:hypothetical protein